MLKYFIILTIIVITTQINAQDYKIIPDEKNGEPLILGYCPARLVNDSTFNNTWTSEYESYKPDYEILDSLKRKLEDINIKIVFRSTCSDSREQLPRFFKILIELNYNLNSITLIGINREKHGLSNEAEGLDIQFVPTIIFYKDGIEIGRIVETPYESLEKDLLKILS
ncbi:MAG TPA: thioredoxin family protein [Ignavibacteriaceae bacterium]|nr:thioredoxin family protein [Ignavibacteriaceae bacterium]